MGMIGKGAKNSVRNEVYSFSGKALTKGFNNPAVYHSGIDRSQDDCAIVSSLPVTLYQIVCNAIYQCTFILFSS